MSAQVHRGGKYRTRFLALWCAAVIAAAAAFVAHLALRFETVRLGYRVGEARETQRELIDRRRFLALETATLRQAGRIESLARSALGMQVPQAERIVTVDDTPEQKRLAGRMR